jgi:hypothetical protein
MAVEELPAQRTTCPGQVVKGTLTPELSNMLGTEKERAGRSLPKGGKN